MKFWRFFARILPRLFRTEKLAHLFTLIILAFSLTIFGAVTSLTQGAILLLERYSTQETLVLFLDQKTPEGEVKALTGKILHQLPRAEVRVQDPRSFARELSRILGLSRAEELAEFSPWTIEIRAKESLPPSWIQEWNHHPRVLYLDAGTMERERLRELVRGARALSFGLVTFLFLLLFFIIGSTISLLLSRRREEIELMDLLGAPHPWISGVYVGVGAFHGISGGLISAGLLLFPLPQLLNPWLLWAGFPVLPKPSLLLFLLLLVSGVLVGTIASLQAVQSFLKRKWY